MFTLILEGDKTNWTEGTIPNIFEDAESRIFNVEFIKFNKLNSLNYMDTQIFTVKSIDSFDYLIRISVLNYTINDFDLFMILNSLCFYLNV